jgi:aspartate kinase
MEIYKHLSGVAIDKDQASVLIVDVPDKPGIAGKIMQALADRNIVIDMIMQAFNPQVGVNSITFTVHQSDLKETIAALEELKKALGATQVMSDEDIAKVSIIGAGLAGQPGIAAKIFSIMGEHGINMKMISTSEMKLTIAVSRAQAEQAAQLIHDAFTLAGVN